MKFLDRFGIKRSRRRSLSFGLEPLEGRRLMATLAIATDLVNNNATIFTLGSDGTVFVNTQRPTGDPAHPTASTGLAALPGLSNVTSIAAIQPINGLAEVLATTGSQSEIYRNVEVFTGDPLKPQVWSGWQSLGGFQAKSIVAAQSTTVIAVFAIGADSNVYQDLEFGGVFSNFTPIPGLSATSITAVADTSDVFQVSALTGPQSFVYQVDTFIPFQTGGTGPENPPGVVKPNLTWSNVSGSFVAGSISESANPSITSNPNGYSILATGGDGRLYRGQENDFAFTTPAPTSFQRIGSPVEGIVSVPLVEVTATLSAGIRYQNIFALGINGLVYEDQALPPIAPATNFTYTGWVALAGLSGTSIAATSTPDGGAKVVARSSNGVTNFEQAAFHPAYGANNQPILNVFTDARRLDAAYHPLSVTTGPNGKPFVVTIGGDGTVYYAQDVSATSSTTTTDTYSSFTPLPGLAASLVSASTEPDGVAVFAFVSGASFVNQYFPSGDGLNLYARTGWLGIQGNAEAMAVANAGGFPSAPTLFEIPYADQGPIRAISLVPPAPSSVGFTATTTTTLDGLTAASMSAKATANGIEVVALTGPQSYPFVNLYAPDPANPGQSKWSGWHVFNNCVMTQAFATNGVGGVPAIAGTSPLGQQVFSEYLPVAGTTGSAWSAFRPIPGAPSTNPQAQVNGADSFQTLASITYKNNLGGAYFDVFAPTTVAVSGFGFTPTPGSNAQGFTGNPAIATIQASSLATTPDFADPSLFAGGDNGRIYVNQGVLSGDPKNPYSYLGWVAPAPLPS